MKDPILELRVGSQVLVRIEHNGVIKGHEVGSFWMTEDQIGRLCQHDPNEQLEIWLLFRKFRGTQFSLFQTKTLGDVIGLLREVDDDVKALARKHGISPKRILHMVARPINSDQELYEHVQQFFLEIRHNVEQTQGYRLLTTGEDHDGLALRSETDIQVALRSWLKPHCEKFNIDLNREPETGRGELDFKFSCGADFKCLAEVKLFPSPRLVHGLEIQLPTYLIAEKATHGVYVPIFGSPSRYQEKSDELKQRAQRVAQEHGLVISVIEIRAWPARSASRATEVDPLSRYET
jgi:hypothetical protein